MREVTKRPIGRPTKYDPSFCAKVREWGSQGKSKAWACAELEISRPTMDLWISKHPDFSYEMEIFALKSQQHWEDLGQQACEGERELNAGLYSRSMSARFKEDWTEKRSTELTGKDGGPVQIERAASLEDFNRSIDLIAQRNSDGSEREK